MPSGKKRSSSFVIFQKPNRELVAAIIGFILGEFFMGWFRTFGLIVFVIAISIWSYREVTDGANWFRKGLGGVVILFVLHLLLSGLL